MILISALSNMVFKALVVALLGHPALLRRIVPLFGLSLGGGIVILRLWPRKVALMIEENQYFRHITFVDEET